MNKELKLYIGGNGAELVVGTQAVVAIEGDLVQTSADSRIRQTAEAVAVSLGDVADVVFNVVEALSKEVTSRNITNHAKMTVSFGVAGGANANLKVVGAKADAFITVQLEFPATIGPAATLAAKPPL